MANNELEYYILETTNYDHINSVWMWCQFSGRDIPMYKTRLSASHTAWVIEIPSTSVETLFLLNFSHWVSPIKKPSYY